MGSQAVFAGLATLLGIVILISMARTEIGKEQLALIGVLIVGVVLALGFGFTRKGSG